MAKRKKCSDAARSVLAVIARTESTRGVSPGALRRHVPELVKLGLLEETDDELIVTEAGAAEVGVELEELEEGKALEEGKTAE